MKTVSLSFNNFIVTITLDGLLEVAKSMNIHEHPLPQRFELAYLHDENSRLYIRDIVEQAIITKNQHINQFIVRM